MKEGKKISMKIVFQCHRCFCAGTEKATKEQVAVIYFIYLIVSLNDEGLMLLKVCAFPEATLSQLQLCSRKKSGRGSLQANPSLVL